jgi:fimbrial chaperone protein
LRVDLGPNQPPAVLTLHNEGDTPALVQLQTFAWTDGGVTEGLPPTDDILAAPPVFEVAPGATQLVRLGLRRPAAGNVERAYRLIIAEVPSAVASDGGGITFVLRLSLPVFVTPPGAVPAPTWTASASADGRGEVRLVNAGTAHLTLRDLRVVDPESQRVLLEVPQPRPVLAGGEYRWRLDGSSGRLPRKLKITAETNAGELEVDVSVRNG